MIRIPCWITTLLVTVAMLTAGCTAERKEAREDRVRKFVDELYKIRIDHFYQDQDLNDVVADIERRTGLRIVLKGKAPGPHIITFRATNMSAILTMFAGVIGGTWGFKNRTIYVGQDLPKLDYQAFIL